MKNFFCKDNVVYIIAIVFSILFIIIGNKTASGGYKLLRGEFADNSFDAVVTEVTGTEDMEYSGGMFGTMIHFKAEISSGDKKGEIIEAVEAINDYQPMGLTPVKKGDRILIYFNGESWEFVEYIRTAPLFWLTMFFFVMLVVFGRKKGVNTILSLVFTCLAIFLVFIPAVLASKNIYFWSTLVCIYSIVMTIIIVNGADKKSACAIIGCFSGVLLSGILTVIMSALMNMTGVLDESSLYLSQINPDMPIDLKAIIFAAIIIGSMGAVMDVSMSVSSSLYELWIKTKAPAKELIQSGISIGRDMMGTMANTLVLAYIGSTLSVTLLLIVYNGSMTELLNKERVIADMLQAVVGSIGILFTIPFTAVICGFMYNLSSEKEDEFRDYTKEELDEFWNEKN